MRIFQKLCGSYFYNVIGKEDFGEVRRWGDEEDIWGRLKKDFAGIIFVGFGGWWKRS